MLHYCWTNSVNLEGREIKVPTFLKMTPSTLGHELINHLVIFMCYNPFWERLTTLPSPSHTILSCCHSLFLSHPVSLCVGLSLFVQLSNLASSLHLFIIFSLCSPSLRALSLPVSVWFSATYAAASLTQILITGGGEKNKREWEREGEGERKGREIERERGREGWGVLGVNYSSYAMTPEGNLPLCESPVKTRERESRLCESDLPKSIFTPVCECVCVCVSCSVLSPKPIMCRLHMETI